MAKGGSLRYDEEWYREYAARNQRSTRAQIDTEVDPPRAVIVPAPEPRRKYGNKKADGFDSRREAKRAGELAILERAGKISSLRHQVKFLLIPKALDADGKIIERACTYRADHVYNDERGHLVVEDSKGVRTSEYVIKRKLMYMVHGIRIREI